VTAQSGAVLQDLVNYCNAAGLRGLETMTGIPGWVGAAVYGNAGAYGHSISERVQRVRFVDGGAIRQFNNEECQFHYRESTFKQNKQWIIVSCELAMTPAEAEGLEQKSAEILTVRNAKYPPDMKCAGSIFKNFLYAELPARVAEQLPSTVVREGKVPSAYFLEHAGVRGLRIGDIQVASYHANLIYNDGSGSAVDLLRVIDEVKTKVRDKFGLELEEEVQYVGFARRNRHEIATI
jgi:UDP-N-acetylmuramate dehydrogenase